MKKWMRKATSLLLIAVMLLSNSGLVILAETAEGTPAATGELVQEPKQGPAGETSTAPDMTSEIAPAQDPTQEATSTSDPQETKQPEANPSESPESDIPTEAPTELPAEPTEEPAGDSTSEPSEEPSAEPTADPSASPEPEPTENGDAASPEPESTENPSPEPAEEALFERGYARILPGNTLYRDDARQQPYGTLAEPAVVYALSRLRTDSPDEDVMAVALCFEQEAVTGYCRAAVLSPLSEGEVAAYLSGEAEFLPGPDGAQLVEAIFEGITPMGLDEPMAISDADFEIDENGVLTKYVGPGGDVVVPSGVTSIGDNAFSYCYDLTSVVLPSSVTSIGWYAFCFCDSLRSIELPSNVKDIGSWAFAECHSLTSIEIPSGVTRIASELFIGCTSLESIKFPSSVTSIGFEAFEGCISLRSIELPASVTHIDAEAFFGCSSLTSIKIPSGVKSIQSSTFNGCSSLTSVELPAGLTSIGLMAFVGCHNLQNIELPSSMTYIGDGAFASCRSLTSIKIPSSVSGIEFVTFSGCINLRSIELPQSLTVIETYAFEGCNNLDITVYDTIREIEDDTFIGATDIRFTIYVRNMTDVSYVEQYCINNNIPYTKVLYGGEETPQIAIHGAFDSDSYAMKVGERLEVGVSASAENANLTRVTINVEGITDNDRVVSKEISGTIWNGTLLLDGTTAPFNVPGTYTIKLFVGVDAGAPNWAEVDQATLVVSEQERRTIQIISPTDGQSVPKNQPLTVHWTEVPEADTYELRLQYESWTDGPIFTVDAPVTSYTLEEKLLSGEFNELTGTWDPLYLWVEALDKNGDVLASSDKIQLEVVEDTPQIAIHGSFDSDSYTMTVGEQLEVGVSASAENANLTRVTINVDEFTESDRLASKEINGTSWNGTLLLDGTAAPLNAPGTYTLKLFVKTDAPEPDNWAEVDRATLVVSAEEKPRKPANPVVNVTVLGTTMTATWEPVEGAASYVYSLRKNPPDGDLIREHVPVLGEACRIVESELEFGTKYNLAVGAVPAGVNHVKNPELCGWGEVEFATEEAVNMPQILSVNLSETKVKPLTLVNITVTANALTDSVDIYTLKPNETKEINENNAVYTVDDATGNRIFRFELNCELVGMYNLRFVALRGKEWDKSVECQIEVVSTLTEPLAPIVLNVNDGDLITDERFTITWNKIDGAEYYLCSCQDLTAGQPLLDHERIEKYEDYDGKFNIQFAFEAGHEYRFWACAVPLGEAYTSANASGKWVEFSYRKMPGFTVTQFDGSGKRNESGVLHWTTPTTGSGQVVYPEQYVIYVDREANGARTRVHSMTVTDSKATSATIDGSVFSEYGTYYIAVYATMYNAWGDIPTSHAVVDLLPPYGIGTPEVLQTGILLNGKYQRYNTYCFEGKYTFWALATDATESVYVYRDGKLINDGMPITNCTDLSDGNRRFTIELDVIEGRHTVGFKATPNGAMNDIAIYGVTPITPHVTKYANSSAQLRTMPETSGYTGPVIPVNTTVEVCGEITVGGVVLNQITYNGATYFVQASLLGNTEQVPQTIRILSPTKPITLGQDVRIEWTPIEGVHHYVISARYTKPNESTPFIDRVSTKDTIYIIKRENKKLHEGEFQVWVGAYKSAEEIEANLICSDILYNIKALTCDHVDKGYHVELEHPHRYLICNVCNQRIEASYQEKGRVLSSCKMCFSADGYSQERSLEMADLNLACYDMGKNNDKYKNKTNALEYYFLTSALVPEGQAWEMFSSFAMSDPEHLAESLIIGESTVDGELILTIVFQGSQDWGDWKADIFQTAAGREGIHYRFNELVNKFIEHVIEESSDTLTVRWNNYGKEYSQNKTVKELLTYIAQHPNSHLRITGHSMGGSLAQIFTYRAIQKYKIPASQIETYTYAALPPFTKSFAQEHEDELTDLRMYNAINIYDFAPDHGVTDNGIRQFYESEAREIKLNMDSRNYEQYVHQQSIENDLLRGLTTLSDSIGNTVEDSLDVLYLYFLCMGSYKIGGGISAIQTILHTFDADHHDGGETLTGTNLGENLYFISDMKWDVDVHNMETYKDIVEESPNPPENADEIFEAAESMLQVFDEAPYSIAVKKDSVWYVHSILTHYSYYVLDQNWDRLYKEIREEDPSIEEIGLIRTSDVPLEAGPVGWDGGNSYAGDINVNSPYITGGFRVSANKILSIDVVRNYIKEKKAPYDAIYKKYQ